MNLFRLPAIIIIASILIILCHTTDQKEPVENDTATTVGPDSVKLQLITSAVNAPAEMNVAPDNSDRLFFTDLSGKY
ncbi:hypothetical protein BH10BAC2_BH10BAC2_32580 [soil metagenome]